MTDREPTDTTLRDIAGADQRMTELNATAGMAGLYFKVLTGYGVPAASATRMAETYNAMMLCKHFDVESHGLALNYFIGPDMEVDE